jgi:hypothetical protein
MPAANSLLWRRLPQFDFECDLTAAELAAIFRDDQWGTPVKKFCQLALHPNTPAEIINELTINAEYLDDDYNPLQRCLWLRAQAQGESTDNLRAEVLAAILHQQLRFARIAGQIKRELSAGIVGGAPLDAQQIEEITSVIEIYAVLANCSIPDPGDKVMIWLISITQDALDFACKELYFFYLIPESEAKTFYFWTRSVHTQLPETGLI